MPTFTIRVELRGNPTAQHFDHLHRQMSSLGFAQDILSGAQKTVNLPSGVYFGSSQYDVATVRNLVILHASNVQPDIRVFVAETINWASHGGVQ